MLSFLSSSQSYNAPVTKNLEPVRDSETEGVGRERRGRCKVKLSLAFIIEPRLFPILIHFFPLVFKQLLSSCTKLLENILCLRVNVKKVLSLSPVFNKKLTNYVFSDSSCQHKDVKRNVQLVTVTRIRPHMEEQSENQEFVQPVADEP